MSCQSDQEKAAEALNVFFKQFGEPDAYNIILLEEVFKVIYGKDLPVLGEERSEGSQNS